MEILITLGVLFVIVIIAVGLTCAPKKEEHNRWILYDPDDDCLATTSLYSCPVEAGFDAHHLNARIIGITV